jgi:hypothetical protein
LEKSYMNESSLKIATLQRKYEDDVNKSCKLLSTDLDV